MFNFTPTEKTKLDEAIDLAHSQLDGYDTTEDGYATTVTQLSNLYEIKRKNAPEKLSKDTMAMVAANLLGILIITHHEQVGIITTKAMSFIMKAK